LLSGVEGGEAVEDQANGALDLQIGILDHTPLVEPQIAGGQVLSVAAALNLPLPAGRQAQLQHM
jgi:hypothetical protein